MSKIKSYTEDKTKKDINNLIMSKSYSLVRSGISLALGQQFVYRIDEETDDKGKVVSRKKVLVENPDEIEDALNAIDVGGTDPDGKYYFITTKEPDIKAIDTLLNRAYGKPTESVKVEGHIDFATSFRNLSLEAMRRIKEVEESKIIDVPVIENKSEGL
jgi:hypothetical protein